MADEPKLPPQLEETADARPYEPPKGRVCWLAMAALLAALGALVTLFVCFAYVMVWTSSWKWFLLLPGALSLAALLLGGAARRRIEGSRGALFGNGARIAGRLAGLAVLMMSITCGIMDGPRIVRPNVKRLACKNNLRQISMALHLYADDNGGSFPPDPGALFPKYADSPCILSCLANPSKWRDLRGPGDFSRETSSYIYVAGLKAGDPGPCVVAFDRPGNHGDGSGQNVLCVDSATQWAKAPAPGKLGALQEMLDQTREFVRKRGGEIKLVGE